MTNHEQGLIMETSSARGLKVWSWLLYCMAAVVALAALLLGLSVGGASAAIPAATIGFQSPLLKPLWDALVSGLQLLGWLVFVAGLVMAALIFCGGMLLANGAALTQRVSRLEAELIAARQITESPAPPDSAESPKSEVHAVTRYAS